MITKKARTRIYVHVDERGQHVSANYFVVVTVITAKDLGMLRRKLREVEDAVGVGKKKWKKTRSENRLNFLRQVVERRIGKGEVFFGVYKKPLPFFFPMLEVIEKGIKRKARGVYTARVWVDGIDKKKANEMTNALRARGISLSRVKSKRDEAEVIIRLADRWAGCVSIGVEKGGEEKKLFNKAIKQGYLRKVST